MDTRELERVRFVARRFGSLQGLRGALIGGAYAAAFGASVLIGGWPPDEDIIWMAFGGALIVMVLGMLRLDETYASRYGRTRGSQSAWRGYLLVAALMGTLGIDHITPPGSPSLFFLGWAAVSTAVAVRDFPYRAHHVIDAAAGGLASLLFARLNASDGFATAFGTGVAIVGTAMIVSGLLDHRILTTTLRPAGEGDHADTV